MDTEKQRSSPDGTVPGQKALPVLTAEDVAALEELCGDVSGYFYKMLDYMDQRVRDGVRRGEFTEEQARADLDLALWYAYACNNIGDYDYYYKAAQWMPASELAAEAAKSGIWYYRYACALMYCGRLEEARHYAETGGALSRPPNTALTANVSALSPSGVEVPCALIYPMSEGCIPARCSARFMQAAAPAPSGQGAVT